MEVEINAGDWIQSCPNLDKPPAADQVSGPRSLAATAANGFDRKHSLPLGSAQHVGHSYIVGSHSAEGGNSHLALSPRRALAHLYLISLS